MSATLAILTLALTQGTPNLRDVESHLVAAWVPNAAVRCTNPSLHGRMIGGVGFVTGPEGRPAFNFGGLDGVIAIPDAPDAWLSQSVTVTAWVWVRDFTPHGSSPAGQIFFRGDDRCGYDPYHLTMLGDGRFEFGIDGESGDRTGVAAFAKREQWIFLVGSFNAETGAISLLCNGILMARTFTTIRPFTALDKGWHPGLAIGNTQFPQGGIHWQPFNGYIGEVRLYDTAIEDPLEAGWLGKRN